jgi:hypothetical protein
LSIGQDFLVESDTAIGRVIALGASNLTRGFHTVVSAARTSWGPDVEVLAALGHGRSYGARSQFVFRTLPGILDSGLWRELESRPRLPTRGLVTDVGNDILYGFSPEVTLGWVEEALIRLRRVTEDIVLTDLPLFNIRRISTQKFLVFRSILVPSCHLSLAQVQERSERVEDGLLSLSASYGARFVRLDPAWYGIDPIHIRPALWRPAWEAILGAHSEGGRNGRFRVEGLRLYLMQPERRWMFGVEQVTPQSGVPLRSGGRVWLY